MLQRTALGPAAISQEHFAAATHVELTAIDLIKGRITGYAAPAEGPKPCALVLLSGSQIVSIARAIRFSAAASDTGVRRGWCGFVISGVEQGLALGGEVQLRCLVSERLFGQWSGEELGGVLRRSTRSFLSVVSLRKHLSIDGGCSNYRQVVPFALDLGRARGSRAVLEASYRYLHTRSLDRLGEESFLDELLEAAAIERVWEVIMRSEEYRARRSIMLPGPFDPGFTFPLEGIDSSDP